VNRTPSTTRKNGSKKRCFVLPPKKTRDLQEKDVTIKKKDWSFLRGRNRKKRRIVNDEYVFLYVGDIGLSICRYWLIYVMDTSLSISKYFLIYVMILAYLCCRYWLTDIVGTG